MGGFTINGCGAADSFYPIKELGEFYCPECRQKRQMCLMEVKRKIKVLYIPTVSINTKYAVGCRSCENGYYISDQQKDDLIYGRAWAEMTEEGLLLHRIKESFSQGTEMTAEGYTEQEETETAREEYTDTDKIPDVGAAPHEIQRPTFCSKCGRELDETTGKCMVCDNAEVPDTTERSGQEEGRKGFPFKDNLAGTLQRKICPACGLLYTADKTNCSVCGMQLEERK